MTNISKHFKRSEFACDCDFDVVDVELLRILEKVRNHFNKPVIITSACRCPKKNKQVGGKSKSQHLLGKAADFVVKDVTAKEVQKYLKSWTGGLGSYATFTHVDVGPNRRW